MLRKVQNAIFAIYAVREFPDKSFYPKLIRLFEQEWAQKAYDYPLWRILYQALANYPSSETVALFEKTTHTTDKFRYQTLCTELLMALTKYPNSLFQPIKDEIKLYSYRQEDLNLEIDAEK